MPPRKSTETQATAKPQAAEKTSTSKTVPEKEANNNEKDKPNVKPRSRPETKPAIKMESADEGAEDTAYEGVPEPQTSKRGPERPPKKNVQVTTPKRGPGRPPKTGAAKKGDISQASKGTGGWVYASEGVVTADKRRVVAKDENGNATFPWTSIITMKFGEPIEYHYHAHRTAYLVVSGGRIAILRKKAGMPAFDSSESAISGALDKQSEVFIIPKNTIYRFGLQTKTVKFVEGHEVLDAATRDLWIVSGEIEWDDGVDSHAVGKVTQEVIDEGDVSGRVMAVWQSEQDRLTAEAAEQKEQEEQDGVTTFKHGVDERHDSQSDGGDGSPSNAKKYFENDGHESFGLDSDVPKKGKDAGTAKEQNELKKSPTKKEGSKKERGTRGRAVRIKK